MQSNRKTGGRTPLVSAVLAVTAVAALVLGACESPLDTPPQEYEITLRADPTSGGSITGDHDVDGSSIVIASPGDEFSWEAVPAAGYVFAGWSSSATGSTTDNPLTYTAQASDTVTASFSPLSEVTISFDSGSSVDEDRGPVTVTLRVADPPGAELDVGVKLSGTAVRGSSDDYTVSGLSGTGEYETATIPAGSTETTFEIAFVNDDVPEGDETIVVSLDDSSSDYTAGPDKTLTIVNDDAGLAAPEIFSSSSYSDGPDGPIYVQDQAETITITNPNSRGTVYYTDDDSDPASSGTRTEYTSAISITATTTIRAVVEDGAEQSGEATTTATFQLFDPTVQVNASDFTGGTVTAGDDVGFITYHVPNGTEVDQGATYYYTLDDSTPDARRIRVHERLHTDGARHGQGHRHPRRLGVEQRGLGGSDQHEDRREYLRQHGRRGRQHLYRHDRTQRRCHGWLQHRRGRSLRRPDRADHRQRGNDHREGRRHAPADQRDGHKERLRGWYGSANGSELQRVVLRG